MNPKENLLREAINHKIREVGLDKKFDFWGLDPNHHLPASHSGENNPDLKKTLKRLDHVDLNDPVMLMLAAQGWEFIWGEPPPPRVVQFKEKVREKAKQHPNQLTHEEKMLLNISAIDTDMF